ncbi:MAG: alpha/beta fold hydrolase [Lachnotalea sp.]
MFSYLRQFETARVEKVIIGDMTPKIVNDDEWKLGLYQGWYKQNNLEEDLFNIVKDYEKFNIFFSCQLITKNRTEDFRDFKMDMTDLLEIIQDRLGGQMNVSENLHALNAITEEQKKIRYDYWKTMSEADFRIDLTKIDVPAGIVYADPGVIYYPATAEYMAEQIPNAVMLPMKDCTPMCVSEKSNDYVQYIVSFCK